MNKEIKDKWVTALRSGEYIQGNGTLRETKDGVDQYCCLGVLCDLYRKEKMVETVFWVKNETESTSIYYRFSDNCPEDEDQFITENINSAILTRNVKEWAGLNKDNPEVKEELLTSLNDRGTSFNKIADLIEESYIVM